MNHFKSPLQNILSKLTYPIRRLYHWIKKSIEYAWFLRNDFDWDYIYIYKLLQYKLKRTRLCLQSDPFHSSANKRRDSKRIKTTELLLERLINDKYMFDLYDKWSDKWQQGVFPDNIEIDKDNPKRKRELEYISEYENYMREQDMDLLFTYLKKYSRSWWA